MTELTIICWLQLSTLLLMLMKPFLSYHITSRINWCVVASRRSRLLTNFNGTVSTMYEEVSAHTMKRQRVIIQRRLQACFDFLPESGLTQRSSKQTHCPWSNINRSQHLRPQSVPACRSPRISRLFLQPTGFTLIRRLQVGGHRWWSSWKFALLTPWSTIYVWRR